MTNKKLKKLNKNKKLESDICIECGNIMKCMLKQNGILWVCKSEKCTNVYFDNYK